MSAITAIKPEKPVITETHLMKNKFITKVEISYVTLKGNQRKEDHREFNNEKLKVISRKYKKRKKNSKMKCLVTVEDLMMIKGKVGNDNGIVRKLNNKRFKLILWQGEKQSKAGVFPITETHVNYGNLIIKFDARSSSVLERNTTKKSKNFHAR